MMSDPMEILVTLREQARADAKATPCSPARGEADTLTEPRALISAMSKRRAQRFFGDAGIPAGWVQSAGHLFFDIDETIYSRDARQHPLSLLLFARKVDGVEPGIYEVTKDRLALRARLDSIPLREVVLQPEFAEAAAIVVAMGSFASEGTNAHTHRRLLARAGSGIEAVWLSAVASDLSGSIFAGFLPSALKQLGIANGYDKFQLLALAVGAELTPIQN